MAWFDQVDLGFGSIQDQFTDLLGEASTLLETANKLDILNLDEMAVQEELCAALEEENEYEEDEEIVHHDGSQVEDQQAAGAINENEPPDDDRHSILQHDDYQKHDGTAPNTESTAQSEAAQLEDTFDYSSTPIKSKSIYDSQPGCVDRSSVLEESFSWEGVEDKPAKPVKMAALNEATKETKYKAAPAVAAQFSIADSDGESKPKMLPAKQTAKAPTAPKPPPQTKPTTTDTATGNTKSTTAGTAPTGRKVKPLKPKPKNKELDFWGVNSKKALKFPEAGNKAKDAAGGSSTQASGTGKSADVAKTGGTAVETHAPDNFFGPVGLFGDDAYVTDDFVDVDLEAAHASSGDVITTRTATTALSGNASGSTSTNINTANSSSSNNSAHQQARLPMGWFSGMVSSADGNAFTSTSLTSHATPSFFDNIDSELAEEDPILMQVAYNKSNPHVQAESSPIDKVLDMWNTFMAFEDPADSSSVGNGTSTEQSASGNSVIPGATKAVEVYSTGTGPAWVVTVLTWFRKLTGVTLIIQDTTQTVRYSGIIFSDTTSMFPNWAFLTVKLTVPADNNAKSILLFTLHIMRLICICAFSILVRISICIYTAIKYCVVYISGSGIGNGAVSARLRRYFANDNVNTILGTTAPAEETWQQRANNSARQWAAWIWEQLNSTNGIMVLTASLFIFSYFKFGRYGTDSGD